MKPMLQLFPESSGTVKLQLVVLGSIAKSDVAPEESPTCVKLRVSLPTFETSTVCAREWVEVAWVANSNWPVVPNLRRIVGVGDGDPVARTPVA
jgi:hypothetical protein